MMLIAACILLLLIGTVSAERKSYEGYAVIKVRAEDEDHVTVLQQLMLNDNQTDFWTGPGRVGSDVRIMVSPGHVDDVTRQLRNSGMKVSFKTRNVQKKLSRMWSEIDLQVDKRTYGYGYMDLNEFNTFHKIYKWLKKTATECGRGVHCEVYSVGQSYEGRPINVFKISKPGAGRQGFWIDATIHAREWISTATAVKIIDHLARGGDSDAERLVDKYDWYIMPVVNPDGYSFTFTDDRYWRKNRHPNAGYDCVGVDLNRNLDVEWGTEGVSHFPCSELYCGPHAASEPEIIAVQNEARHLASGLQGWLSMHSFGRMWMFPSATTVRHSADSPCERVPDHSDLMDVANAAANAIEARHGTRWARGTICEVVYAASGGTVDYVKGVGVKNAFAAELRGNDFVVDKRQIQLSFEEIWSGIVAMCDAIAAKEG